MYTEVGAALCTLFTVALFLLLALPIFIVWGNPMECARIPNWFGVEGQVGRRGTGMKYRDEQRQVVS